MSSPRDPRGQAIDKVEVRLGLSQGPVPTVRVRLAFDAGDRHATRIYLPSAGDADDRRWRLLAGLEAQGARLGDLSPGVVVLHHAQGAYVALSYEILDGYRGTEGSPLDLYKPRFEADHVVLFGERVIATPEQAAHAEVDIRWDPMPEGWVGEVALPRASARVTDLKHAVFLAARRDQHRVIAPAGASGVTVTSLGRAHATALRIGELIERLLPACLRFWESPHDVRAVIVAGVEGATMSAQIAARKLPGILVFLVNIDDPPKTLDFLVAHELTHGWCPFRLTSSQRIEPKDYWFSEGLTDYFAAKVLLAAGVWTCDDFIRHLNRALVRYASSPFKAKTLEEMLAVWPAHGLAKHLYDRGRLLATRWEMLNWKTPVSGRLRQATIALSQAREAGHDDSPATPLLMAWREAAGLDVADEVQRHIVGAEGIVLELPQATHDIVVTWRKPSPVDDDAAVANGAVDFQTVEILPGAAPDTLKLKFINF